MPRIRTIKPTFFRSRAVRRLSSSDVKLVWIGLWPLADDDGRLLDEPGQLVGDLWALDLTPDQIEAALDELDTAERIQRYQVGGERFIQITNWSDHQRISKPNPSDLPPAPLPEASRSATGTFQVGKERNGKEEEGSAPALTPFCNQHPNGTERSCRACGNARRAYDAWVKTEKNRPTVVPDAAASGLCMHYVPADECWQCLAQKAVS